MSIAEIDQIILIGSISVSTFIIGFGIGYFKGWLDWF